MKKIRGWFSQLNKFNLLIWLLYVVLLIFVSYNHEPWHDEGQAWLIARDDSLWQLLTVTTHYEGHPPLWHMSLMPFAKLGVPFLLGLKTVNIFFASVAMGILIFKSPFPWYLRFTFPFTYYCFYQFGVVNRVYSLLMLAIMFVAYYYPQRKQHPFKLATSLAIASGAQAYGMMFACGVAIVWLIEVLKREHIKLKNFCYNLRKLLELQSLVLLLLVSVCFGLCIIPFKDTAFISNGAKTGFWENMFYLITVMPSQLLASNNLQNNASKNTIDFFFVNAKVYGDLISRQGIYGVALAIHWFISYTYGIFLNLGILYVSNIVKMALLFLCPFLLMDFLGSLVFFNIYHAGIWYCFYIFILWQIWSDKKNLILVEETLKKKFTFSKEYIFAKIGFVICIFGIFLTNFSWTWQASKNNILYDTDPSGRIATFIKENCLIDNNIWVPAIYSKNDKKSLSNVVTGPLAVNCFFSHNVFQNLDGGRTNHAYHEYKLLPIQTYLGGVRKYGQPDFIVGEDNNLGYVFPNHEKYIPVEGIKSYFVWKDSIKDTELYIYVREDMLEKLPWLHRIPDKPDMGM